LKTQGIFSPTLWPPCNCSIVYLISVLKSLELASASSLKKHRSLEDLQTNGIREEEEDAVSQSVTCEKKSSRRSPRGCGVNESFRAAIDRSYDPDGTNGIDAGNMLCACIDVCL